MIEREKKQDQEAQNPPSNPDHRRIKPASADHAIVDPLTHVIANHAIHETHRPTPSPIMQKEQRKDIEEIEKEERGLRSLMKRKRRKRERKRWIILIERERKVK